MKVSIITPSFNQAEFIERTIQSVLSQNDGPYEFEYVVMDGGSTDQTLAILKRYQHQLSWKSESDRGQAHAVNKGLQMTTGDIIGWLNSDDIYYPETVKKICQFFAEHPEIDVVYGDAHFINRDDKKIGFYPTEPWDLQRLKTSCFISQPATFFRRSVVVKYGLLNELLQFCMDYAYWLHLGLSGAKFAYLPQILAGTRVYPETKSSRCSVEASSETIHLVKKQLGYIPATWFVSYAGACVKANSGLYYPDPRFIVGVWANLWKTTGLHHRGLYRMLLWLTTHQIMLKEFLKRSFNLFRKKLKYRG